MPGSTLPTTGPIRYGQGADAHTFTNTARTTSFAVKPKYATDGRGVLWNEVSLAVEDHIVAANTSAGTDALVRAARRTLTRPGQPFVYDGRGMGLPEINVRTARDAAWGPKCDGLEFRPLGGKQACGLTWRVTVALPDCDDAVFAFKTAAVVWTWSVQPDPAGYSTRTITVKATIPNNRIKTGLAVPFDSPDLYREKLSPQLVPGFRRVYGPWTVNEARTELTGTVIDIELGENYPPEWVANMTASAGVESGEKGLTTWTGFISAEYELTKHAPDRWTPYKHFIGVLVRDRINAAAQELGKASQSIVPLSFRLTEPEIMGRRKAAFSLAYAFTTEVKNILAASALWRPLPGSNWQRWAYSMQQSAFHPRGHAGLVLRPEADAIVDLCGPGPTPGVFTGTAGVPNPPAGGPVAPPPGRETVLDNKPDADESWILYESEIFVEVDSGTVAVQTLPTRRLTSGDDILGGVADLAGAALDAFAGVRGGMPRFPGAGGGGASRPSGGGQMVNQRRARPQVFCYLRGKAARYGHPIPVPRLIRIGDLEAVPANRLDRGEGYAQGIKYAAGSHPIYTLTFNLRYSLPDAPDSRVPLPVPPNPMLAGANTPGSGGFPGPGGASGPSAPPPLPPGGLRPSLVATYPAGTYPAGTTIFFAAAAGGGVPPYFFGLDFGDGATGNAPTSHAWSAGTYTVTLTVRDAAGNVATAQINYVFT